MSALHESASIDFTIWLMRVIGHFLAVGGVEENLFRLVNHGLAGEWTDWLMRKATTPGTWTIPVIILCAGIFYYDRRRGIVAIITALIAVGIGDAFAYYVVKSIVARSRPCIALQDVHLLVGCVNSYSFPSNHAVNTLAVAGALGRYYRPLLWVLLPIGALVCLSRVAVGVHYPSDVVVGGALGFGIGWSVAVVTEKIWKKRNER